MKAKAGLKGTGKIETFTSAKITSIKQKLQLDINKLDADIAKFNDDTTLEVDNADEFKNFITA